jgi:hypothetical protein
MQFPRFWHGTVLSSPTSQLKRMRRLVASWLCTPIDRHKKCIMLQSKDQAVVVVCLIYCELIFLTR